MARTLLVAVVLFASLPAALCEAACAPPAAASAAPMEAHGEAMPCHGAPEPAAPAEPHDATDCPTCQLEIAASKTAPPAAAHLSVALAPLPGGSPVGLAPSRRAAHPPREPPGLATGAYARQNAPLLN